MEKTKEKLCKCGHQEVYHIWILPSTGEKHKFRTDCKICVCKKYKEVKPNSSQQ